MTIYTIRKSKTKAIADVTFKLKINIFAFCLGIRFQDNHLGTGSLAGQLVETFAV